MYLTKSGSSLFYGNTMIKLNYKLNTNKTKTFNRDLSLTYIFFSDTKPVLINRMQ